ncbi:hypothetical protein DS909_22145 [Phaeobacter gallaeciensis]|uniref:Uncharacterized protein n=1 Tax=Phaeobacter gallaeciensis TaxID=60890 RepID=A0A366WJP7_9RHOB|nr:hypothetical protein DS909_22145 [Phaeobacter gallaeciensis]
MGDLHSVSAENSGDPGDVTEGSSRCQSVFLFGMIVPVGDRSPKHVFGCQLGKIRQRIQIDLATAFPGRRPNI